MISCLLYLMLILASMASMEETFQDTVAQETTSPSTGNQTQESKKKGGRMAGPTTGCSIGWSPLTTGGNTQCYKVFPDARVSWYRAQHLCLYECANLASIPSQTINSFIQKLVLSSRTSSWQVYIGGYKPTGTSSNFNWAWWSGTTNTGYWDWGHDSPSGDGNCVTMSPRDGRGRWNDLSCNEHKFAYVCGKPALKP